MAFNTLRGTVNFSNATTGTIESMVDDYSDQTLKGGKTFAQKLTASAISLAGSVLEHPAITAIGGDAENRVIISDGDGTATCDAGLVFSKSSLTASYYSGSAIGLTNVSLAPHKISVGLSASNLFYGVGLSASQGNAIAVSGGVGIASTAQGVYVDLPSNSGLNFSSDKLIVDPNNATTKGSWTGTDEVLIADSDAGSALKKATVTTLTTYLQNTLTFTTPGGADNNIQTKSGTDFAGSANLTFDGTKVALTGDISGSGYVSASYFVGDGSGLSNVAGHVTPGGSDTNIQFHSGSEFSGSTKLVFDYATTTAALKLTGEFSASNEASLGGVDVYYAGIKQAFMSSSGVISGSRLNVSGQVSASANVSGSAFYGDGNKLNNVPITTYTNTRLIFCGATTDTLATYDGLTWSNPIMSVPGTVSATHLSASTLVSASAFYGDGSGLTNVGGGTPGGINTAVQFNSGSSLSGSSKLLFDYAESTAVLKLVGQFSASSDASVGGLNLFHAGIKRVHLSSSGEVSASAAVSASSMHTLNTVINTTHLSSSLNISGSSFYGEGTRLTYPGNNKEIAWFSSGTLTQDAAMLYVEPGEAGPETSTLVVGTQLSSSQTISASFFYGDGANLTGLPAGTPATASGGTGEIQFARTVDGEFSSDGALTFNTGSSGATGAYLTSSNLVVSYNTHLTGALYGGYKIKNSNYTLTSDDHYVYFNTTPVFNLTASLPEASNVDGIIYVIKNVGSGELRVSANGSDLIDGAAYDEGPVGWGLSVQSINGSSWAIIHRI